MGLVILLSGKSVLAFDHPTLVEETDMQKTLASAWF